MYIYTYKFPSCNICSFLQTNNRVFSDARLSTYIHIHISPEIGSVPTYSTPCGTFLERSGRDLSIGTLVGTAGVLLAPGDMEF